MKKSKELYPVRTIILANSLLLQLSAFVHLRPRRAGLSAGLLALATLAITTQAATAAVIEAWVQRYNGPANAEDYASSLVMDKSGNIMVAGTSFNGTNYDCYTAKYAANGTLLWEKRYNDPLNYHDSPGVVALDSEGDVVVSGSANETEGADATSAYYTAKYAAADGALLWERLYDGPADSYNYGMAMAVDGNDNVAVTGGSISANGDYYTAKYAAADGALLWEKRYNGPGDDEDQANALAVDAGGNVVVTGYSVNTNGNTDYYTAKYTAEDGALLWEKRYGGVEDGYDQAIAMVADASGNVVVTGGSQNNGGNTDYYTAKYAAANGALLWEHRFNGPADAYDFANAVAVDGSGNVVVTGLSNNGTNTDFYTAKYAALDGALLWEKRYNGPGNADDSATAVAADGSGNVVVTGYSIGSGGTNDYYTAKYAAANGTLLWEKRYHGPTNGNDYASSLALGPNGIVAITGSSVGDNGTSDDYATVVYWENLPPISLEVVPTGVCLHFGGAPTQSYQIERAPAVTGLWSALATLTAPIGGLIEYVDTNAPASAAFYRMRAP